MKQKQTPKVFNPTQEEEKIVALKIAKLLSPDKVVITRSGEKVRGTRKL